MVHFLKIYDDFTYQKLWFSIATLNNQTVSWFWLGQEIPIVFFIGVGGYTK